MRPVTLYLGGVKDPAVVAALTEIQKASHDTLQNDTSSSGGAISTLVGATLGSGGPEIPYFVDQYHVKYLPINAGGAWTAWTPTVTARTPGVTPPTFTVNEAKYMQVGKLVTFHIDITINTVGTATQNLLFTLPVAATTISQQPIAGFEVGVAAVFIGGAINNTNSDASHCTTLQYNGASIFAIGNGARPTFAGTYEAA